MINNILLRPVYSFALSVFALMWAFSPSAMASDPNTPHEHQGILPSFSGAPPVVEIARQEMVQLMNGETVMKQVDQGAGGQAVAIFWVHATPDQVMDVVLDFSQYSNWIDSLNESVTYVGSDCSPCVRMKTSVLGFGVEWYNRHQQNREEGWITWTLDYSRNSDLDDSVGFWRFTPVSRDGWTQVVYSIDVQLKGWVPGIVRRMLVSSGLEDATTWVKEQSEARAGH